VDWKSFLDSLNGTCVSASVDREKKAVCIGSQRDCLVPPSAVDRFVLVFGEQMSILPARSDRFTGLLLSFIGIFLKAGDCPNVSSVPHSEPINLQLIPECHLIGL
jgi:hypothetical protein